METKRNGFVELIKIIGMGILVFLPLVFLCFYTASQQMAYGDDELSYYLWNRNVTAVPSDREYTTLILGDSSANAAYLPEMLSEGTVSLALGGTTVIENYYVLSNWLDTHAAPECIYVSFMDYHMIYDNMFYERTVYAHLLTPAQEREILEQARIHGEENIAVPDAELKLFQYDNWLPNIYLPSLLNAGFNGRRASNQANYDSIALHRGAYIGLTTDMYHDTDPNVYDSYPVNPIFDVYYRKLLDLCQEQGIKIRIVSLPKTGNSVLSDAYRSARDGYYEELVSGYDNASYEAFQDTLPTKLFHDWEHTNLYGAAEWSKIIRTRFPEDFPEEPVTDASKQGIRAYMDLAEDAGGLLSLCDGTTFAAVAVTSENLKLLSGFEDTGLTVKDRSVYVQNGADLTVRVQEENPDPNGFCIWSEPDGTNAIVSHGTVYSIVIDAYADLTLLIVDTKTHQPLVRNYMYSGDGLLGH